MHAYLIQALVFLIATVVVVPVSERLKTSPVVGYLFAGALIGPHGLRVIADAKGVLDLAELGVALLLFTIGLELSVERFRMLGRRSFALGAAQVAGTGIAVALAAWGLGGVAAGPAVILGGALAMSSTAVVLQVMIERHELNTRVGRTAIAVLLVQDLAVAPFLVLIPMLGGADSEAALAAIGIAGAKTALALGIILTIGRLVVRPALRLVDEAKAPELSMALILLVILATALATHWAGLSMALGAFMAGMVIAETEYRHKVETDIQPFRGLMLGLFFMAVGMNVDIGLLVQRPFLVAGLVLAVLAAKGAVLALAARVLGYGTVTAARLGIVMAQGGEFSFVLLSLALAAGALPWQVAQPLLLVVAVTMALTPFLAALGGGLSRRFEPHQAPGVESLRALTEDLEDHIVVAGFGRVGKDVASRFKRHGVAFVVLETDLRKVIDGNALGFPVFHADGTDPEALDAAAIPKAQAVIVAIGEAKGAKELVALLRYLFPEMRILARARDYAHGRELVRAGATEVAIEMQEAGQQLAGTFVVPVD
ncbi:MAG: monovalent cation:proton antiporter-2 (CPA2) family protein [Magnetospirillum sp. WYHS-4]